MIVSNKPHRTNSRWLQALVILCAVVVLPLGAHLYAKENSEVKKDKPAVTKSEVKKPDAEKQTAEEYLKSTWQELQAEVEAGRLTKNEAKAKYEEQEMALKLSACEGACAKAEYKAAAAKLDVEVAAGNVSAEEAKSRLADAQEEIKAQQAAQREKYLALVKAWDRQETLIGEGMATFEEAVQEYEHAKQQVLNGAGIYASAGQPYQEAVSTFQAAIESGTMSPAEAFTRLSTVEMNAYAREFTKAEQMYAQEAVTASLAAAVARGEITPEEAEFKLQAYQNDLAAKDESAKLEMKKAASEEADKQKQQELEHKKKAQTKKDAKEDKEE